MPGHMKYRTLGRDSAHRQALLRNLVTSLFKTESISTTWPKAKEAQRLAEKVITLAKKNTEASRRRVEQILYTPHQLTPRLFTTIRDRYLTRPGGYTRVLRIEPIKQDQAPSAILELVDGDRDMRFALTAQTIARDRLLDKPSNPMTLRNQQKVIAYREKGEEEFEAMVRKFMRMEREGVTGRGEVKKQEIITEKGEPGQVTDIGDTGGGQLKAKSMARRMEMQQG